MRRRPKLRFAIPLGTTATAARGALPFLGRRFLTAFWLGGGWDDGGISVFACLYSMDACGVSLHTVLHLTSHRKLIWVLPVMSDTLLIVFDVPPRETHIIQLRSTTPGLGCGLQPHIFHPILQMVHTVARSTNSQKSTEQVCGCLPEHYFDHLLDQFPIGSFIIVPGSHFLDPRSCIPDL